MESTIPKVYEDRILARFEFHGCISGVEINTIKAGHAQYTCLPPRIWQNWFCLTLNTYASELRIGA